MAIAPRPGSAAAGRCARPAAARAAAGVGALHRRLRRERPGAIDELITLVNIALGNAARSACPSFVDSARSASTTCSGSSRNALDRLRGAGVPATRRQRPGRRRGRLCRVTAWIQLAFAAAVDPFDPGRSISPAATPSSDRVGQRRSAPRRRRPQSAPVRCPPVRPAWSRGRRHQLSFSVAAAAAPGDRALRPQRPRRTSPLPGRRVDGRRHLDRHGAAPRRAAARRADGPAADLRRPAAGDQSRSTDSARSRTSSSSCPTRPISRRCRSRRPHRSIRWPPSASSISTRTARPTASAFRSASSRAATPASTAVVAHSLLIFPSIPLTPNAAATASSSRAASWSIPRGRSTNPNSSARPRGAGGRTRAMRRDACGRLPATSSRRSQASAAAADRSRRRRAGAAHHRAFDRPDRRRLLAIEGSRPSAAPPASYAITAVEAQPEDSPLAAIVRGTWQAPEWREDDPRRYFARDARGRPCRRERSRCRSRWRCRKRRCTGRCRSPCTSTATPAAAENEVPSAARRSLATDGFAVIGFTDILNRELSPGITDPDQAILAQMAPVLDGISNKRAGPGLLERDARRDAGLPALLRRARHARRAAGRRPGRRARTRCRRAARLPRHQRGRQQRPGLPPLRAGDPCRRDRGRRRAARRGADPPGRRPVPQRARRDLPQPDAGRHLGRRVAVPDHLRPPGRAQPRALPLSRPAAGGRHRCASRASWPLEGLNDSLVPNHATDSMAWSMGPIPHMSIRCSAPCRSSPWSRRRSQANIDAQTTAGSISTYRPAYPASRRRRAAKPQPEGHYCAQTAPAALHQRSVFFHQRAAGRAGDHRPARASRQRPPRAPWSRWSGSSALRGGRARVQARPGIMQRSQCRERASRRVIRAGSAGPTGTEAGATHPANATAPPALRPRTPARSGCGSWPLPAARCGRGRRTAACATAPCRGGASRPRVRGPGSRSCPADRTGRPGRLRRQHLRHVGALQVAVVGHDADAGRACRAGPAGARCAARAAPAR